MQDGRFVMVLLLCLGGKCRTRRIWVGNDTLKGPVTGPPATAAGKEALS